MRIARLGKAFLLNSVRGLLRNLRDFFRAFGEQDVCALLSAYGLYGPEIARLQEACGNDRNEAHGNLPIRRPVSSIGQFPGPIPIGVHPDFSQSYQKNVLAGRKFSVHREK
jgi:hypothetical protein